MAKSIRVVTYNVLSPPLCSKKWFPLCSEENLDEATRFERITNILRDHMQHQAIICLQEVDLTWYGKFAIFFEQNGYTAFIHHYKSSMGVAIAYMRDRFTADKLVAEKVSDFISRPQEAPPGYDPSQPPQTRPAFDRKKNAAPLGLLAMLTSPFTWALQFVAQVTKPRTPAILAAIDEYEQIVEASYRQNVYLLAILRDRENENKEFCVATYHMPCAFTQPKVMSLHTYFLAQRVLAKAQNRPCILAGDFNFQPASDCYKLLTSGKMDSSDPGFVAKLPSRQATTTDGAAAMVLPTKFVSAVKAANGEEPDFTNNAVNLNNSFIGTLDYFFLANNVQTVAAIKLPHRDTVTDGPFPNASEPSDHTSLWCDLKL